MAKKKNEKRVVLIVDDRPENLDLLISFLEKYAFNIMVAKSGEDVFKRLKYNRPDIILLDIMMPGIDGYETCKRLKMSSEHKDIPVIFMSALDDTVDKVKGLELGAIDYIAKPFVHEEVLARIRNHLHIQDLKDKLETANSSLKKANHRLKEIDHLKSMFIASMSHELRTPLNSIIGFTGMTLMGLSGELNEEQKDNIQRVYNSSKHLLELINDVIDISKIEAGAVESFCEPFSLHEIVSEAICNVEHLLKGKEVVIDTDVPKEINMNSDRKRVLQCVVNLLSNAVKYTKIGKINISAIIIGESIELSVTDTGIGIAKNDINKLFKPFERLKSSLRVKAGGAGLGLYLTRKITSEILQGAIEVESKEGEGSSFKLRTPIILGIKKYD